MVSGPESAAAQRPEASDIAAGNWIDRRAPAGLRPYLRLARIDRPIGTWLLLFPCWWSVALADAALGQSPSWSLYLLFGIGAVVMRGAGCTLNDILDRDFDARVARTAGRPIPSGQVSVRQALAFMAALMLVGLLVLLQLNATAIWFGIASLALVFPYPLMKRITYWPQFWLGLTFNWGALMGWTAVMGEPGWPMLWLYLAGIVWTLGYDTIYAHQDKEDDVLIGVKSTALRLGRATRPWLVGFYALTTLLLAVTGLVAGIPAVFLLGVAAAAAHFAWQVTTLDIDSPANCLRLFHSNRFVGWLVLAALLLAAQVA